MFDSKHYVPILKWKAAERLALVNLSAEEKKLITPLIQLVMPKPKNLNKDNTEKTREEQLRESVAIFKAKVPEIPEEILKFWGSNPAFIDLSLIDASLREESFNAILTIGKNLGTFLIPVVTLNSSMEIKNKVARLGKKDNHGICLRLFRSDFLNQNTLAENIQKFLADHVLLEKEVDLLIDFQITDEICSKLVELSKQIPNILKWRTFIFANGAFPVDLTNCELGENIIDRSDWKKWSDQLNSKDLIRKPSFSDYTIQHPIYKESFQFFSPSASIKYTLSDSWLIMRGQKRKSIQYLANAQLLSKHPKFFGANFSYGDTYVAEKGKDLNGKPGNATNWLVAGINHHLACTANQIANLP